MSESAFVLQETRSIPKEEYPAYLLYMPRGVVRLGKLGESVFFPKKHVILEPGEFTKYCYVVKSGRVVSYEDYTNGEERIYHFHEKDSVFLEANVLFDKPALVGYRTTADSELIRIDKRTLLNAIKEDYQLALDVIESTAYKYASAMEQIRHMRNKNAVWKICNLFLSLAEYNGIDYGNKILLREKISQQTIASMLGMNRITAVRAVKQLKDEGFVEQVGGYYCICDVEGLLEYQQSLEEN